MPQEITIQPLPAAKAIAAELIRADHPELKEAKLLWLVTTGKVKCAPKVLNPFERYLSSGDVDPTVEDGFDLACIVNEELWDYLAVTNGAEGRRALVDHLLCHIERQVDDEGTVVWKIAKHPIEEFPDVVRRHGLWRPELRDFGALVRQLALPTPESVPTISLSAADMPVFEAAVDEAERRAAAPVGSES